jgi:hypothetical protein
MIPEGLTVAMEPDPISDAIPDVALSMVLSTTLTVAGAGPFRTQMAAEATFESVEW